MRGTFSAGSDNGLPMPLKGFLAPQKQMKQAMAELKPNLDLLKRDLASAFGGMDWNFGHTGMGPQSFGSDGGLLAKIIPDSAFKQAEKDLKSNLGHLERELEKQFKGMKWNTPTASAPSFLQKMSGSLGGKGIKSMLSGAGASEGVSTAIGGIFGTLGTLRIAFWELQPVLSAFKIALQQIIPALAAGEKLFIKASQLGRTTGSEFSARFAGNAIGMSDEDVDRMALQSAHGGKGGNNLARFDAVTKLISPSLAKPFEDAYRFSQSLGKEWQKISGELFTSKKMFSRVSAQWELFGAEIAAKLSPSLRMFADMLSKLPWADMGKAIGNLLAPFALLINNLTLTGNILNKLNLLKPAPGSGLWLLDKIVDVGNSAISDKPYEQTNLRLPGGIALPQLGQWEKLGLTFGAGGNNSAAQQTSTNTKKSADMLSIIASYMSKGVGFEDYAANAP